MATPVIQPLGSFTVGRKTATAGTAIAILIPPYPGGAAPGIGQAGLPGLQASIKRQLRGVPHVTTLWFIGGGHENLVYLMRPQNYTFVASAAAAAQAVINLYDDPGLAANYKYDLANGQTVPSSANDGIAANDYCAYQAAPGQWVLDTVASVSTLAITMTSNVPTGGVLAGSLFYYFGVNTDVDPATNAAFMALDPGTSAVLQAFSDTNGIFASLHPGDPLVLYDANATTADVISLVCGYYADR